MLLAPGGHTQCQRLRFRRLDAFSQASHQHARADAADLLARDFAYFDGNAKVEPELEQDFIEDVVAAAASFKVFEVIEQGCFQIAAVGVPGADVGCV